MKLKTILSCLITCLGLVAFAQVQPVLWFHQISKAEGLSNTQQINDVFQDSEGYVWIATPSGLNRYDGNTMKNYLADATDPGAITNNRVHGRFFEDSKKISGFVMMLPFSVTIGRRTGFLPTPLVDTEETH